MDRTERPSDCSTERREFKVLRHEEDESWYKRHGEVMKGYSKGTKWFGWHSGLGYTRGFEVAARDGRAWVWVCAQARHSMPYIYFTSHVVW